MKSKVVVIFLFNFLCISAADEQFYLHDNFIVNLDFDDLQDVGVKVESSYQDLLGDEVDEFDFISNYFDNILMKDFIEKIIGKNVKNDNKPIENLIITINSWPHVMSPKEFKDIFTMIKDVANSDMYENLPKLQFACKNVTEFIMNFINMPTNRLRAEYLVDHAAAWQQSVDTIHQYL